MNKISILLTFTLLILMCSISSGQDNACQEGEVAVGGYDITSYFEDDLVKGDENIQATHKGVIYHFASEENKAKFIKNPDRFMPAYGGWCAMALCQGKLVQPNPKIYSVIDNKLHLFEVKVFYNGKAVWFKDPKENKKTADQKYQELKAAKKQ